MTCRLSMLLVSAARGAGAAPPGRIIPDQCKVHKAISSQAVADERMSPGARFGTERDAQYRSLFEKILNLAPPSVIGGARVA